MSRRGRTPAEAKASLRERFRHYANDQRRQADELTAEWGCDDPLSPMGSLAERQRHYTNWIEFANVVCRPIVEAEDDEAAVQAAMVLYRQACPHYIAGALVMAANRVQP
jgi:hypothetical protein